MISEYTGDSKESSNDAVKNHIIETAKYKVLEIENKDGWTKLNIPKLSEKELNKVADNYGLKDDEQSRCFIRFVSMSSNFASATFIEKLRIVPSLVNSIQDLIQKMKEEVKEFAEIAVQLEELINVFVRLVVNTRHNFSMVLPDIKESVKIQFY